MKKIFALIMIAVCFMCIQRLLENNQAEVTLPMNTTPIPNILSDSIQLNQEQINEIVTKTSELAKDFQIVLLDNNQIQLNLVLSEQMIELIPEKQLKEMGSIINLFENETISCIVSFKEDLTLDLKDCSAAGIPIPKSLYQSKIEIINSQLTQLKDLFNIDSLKVSAQEIEVKGDIDKILDYIED